MDQNFSMKLLGITGDCPALSLICNFVHHNGYHSCWLCFIRGIHMNHKQQYCHQQLVLRFPQRFSELSSEAERTKKNVYGHFGKSIIARLLDIPLPNAIVLDYLHVSLLGHAKVITLSIYNRLRPAERKQLNIDLNGQQFPRKGLLYFILFGHISLDVSIALVV